MDPRDQKLIEAIRKRLANQVETELCPNCRRQDFEIEEDLHRKCKCGARWLLWAPHEKRVKQWP